MPAVVRVENRTYEIPEGPHRLRVAEHDIRRQVQVQVEYSFNLPDEEVRVRTWETPSIAWSKDTENNVVPEAALVNDQSFHVSEFLVEHYAGPLRGGLDERALGRKEEHEDWKRNEIKRRGLAKTYGKYGLPHPPSPKKHKKAERDHNWYVDNGAFAKKKGEDMTKLVTGSRVRLPDPMGDEKYAHGTVVEVKDPLPKGLILLCMDRQSEHYEDCPDICGEGHGLLARQSSLRSAGFRDRKSAYRDIPDHIGMFAPAAFDYENMHFAQNSLGRIVELNADTVTMQWFNVEGMHSPIYVPKESLRWCRFDTDTLKIKRTWYTTYCPLIPGDVLAYNSDKALQVSGGYVVTRGVLLKHAGFDRERCCINATILSGMDPEILGMNCKVRKQDVLKFEEPFLERGEEVEVVAQIMFKKRDIQGSRGKVVLATDIDGDVGIQFPENINAGSLDGVGKEGCCLYVPSDAVRKVSE